MALFRFFFNYTNINYKIVGHFLEQSFELGIVAQISIYFSNNIKKMFIPHFKLEMINNHENAANVSLDWLQTCVKSKMK